MRALNRLIHGKLEDFILPIKTYSFIKIDKCFPLIFCPDFYVFCPDAYILCPDAYIFCPDAYIMIT